MSDTARLKNGEMMEWRVIDDPGDPDVPGLRELLGHKGDIWQYHLDAWAAGDAKRLDTYFYVGRIGDEFVGNIMVVVHRGVGLMGHVFTRPSHRRKGICDALMDVHMDDFEKRGGKVVYLNTGYESAPYRIYGAHGYRPVPDRPGSMWWSPGQYGDLEGLYDDVYGNLDRADVTEPSWRHWPSMNVFTQLPLARVEQTVRNVTYGVFGVSHAEAAFLAIMIDARESGGVQSRVVETRGGQVAGLATLGPERRWGRPAATLVFDICLHPGASAHAKGLVTQLDWPDEHVLAYAADGEEDHIELLASAGFRPHGHIERFFRDGSGLVVMDRN